MTTLEFQTQLQTSVDRNLSVKTNPRVPGMAGVYFKGEYLFAIPDGNIYEEKKPGYGVVGFDGRMIAHRTIGEALILAKHYVNKAKSDSDYFDALTGQGNYAKDKLK